MADPRLVAAFAVGTGAYDFRAIPGIRSARVRRGADTTGPLVRHEAATCTLVADNRTRWLDPTYVDSPLWGPGPRPAVEPERKIHLAAFYPNTVNLLPRPASDGGDSAAGAGWTGVGSPPLTYSTTRAQSGTGSMRLAFVSGEAVNAGMRYDGGRTTPHLDHAVLVRPGQQITVSAYWYTDNLGVTVTGYVGVEWWDGAAWTLAWAGSAALANATWQRVSGTLTVPETAWWARLRVAVAGGTTTAAGNVYCDSAQVEEAAAASPHSAGGVYYPLFTGWVDDWDLEYDLPHEATATCTASDGAKVLNVDRSERNPAGAGEDTGARITRILDDVGWPAGDRDIQSGEVTCNPTTLANSAWTELLLTTDTEQGALWLDAGGVLRYRRRGWLDRDTRSATTQMALGDGASLITAPHTNLLINSSFEQPVDEFALDAEWTAYTAGTAPTSRTYSHPEPENLRITDSIDSSDCLRIDFTGFNRASTNKAGVETAAAKRPAVSAGQAYTASAYMRLGTAETDVSLVVEVVWYNASAAVVGSQPRAVWNGTSTLAQTSRPFRRIAVTGTAPTGAVKAGVRCYVQGRASGTATVSVEVDAAQFEAGTAARLYVDGFQPWGTWDTYTPRVNLCPNPSAERDTAGWRIEDNTSLATYLEQDPLNGVRGSTAFKCYGAPANNFSELGMSMGGFSFAAGQQVTIAFDARINANGDRIQVRLRDDAAGVTFATALDVPVTSLNAWNRYVVTTTVPVGRTLSRIYLYGIDSQTDWDNNPVWFDGIIIEAGATDGSYFDGDTVRCLWDGVPHASTSRQGPLLADSTATLAITERPYTSARVVYAADRMVNSCSAARAGGTASRIEAVASVERYRRRTLTRHDLIMDTDAQAVTWAEKIVARWAYPDLQVDQIEMHPRAGGGDYWADLLAAQTGDRWLVRVRPPGPDRDVLRSVHVQGVDWDLVPGAKSRAVFAVSDAKRISEFLFRLGDPVLGRLDVNALG
ncbi:MAG: hypothetical protein ACOYY2_13025 [Actinomycetota bacterium]